MYLKACGHTYLKACGHASELVVKSYIVVMPSLNSGYTLAYVIFPVPQLPRMRAPFLCSPFLPPSVILYYFSLYTRSASLKLKDQLKQKSELLNAEQEKQEASVVRTAEILFMHMHYLHFILIFTE